MCVPARRVLQLFVATFHSLSAHPHTPFLAEWGPGNLTTWWLCKQARAVSVLESWYQWSRAGKSRPSAYFGYVGTHKNTCTRANICLQIYLFGNADWSPYKQSM